MELVNYILEVLGGCSHLYIGGTIIYWRYRVEEVNYILEV